MFKRSLLALCLIPALLLSGCSAMLQRSYVSVEKHNENPVSDGGSALRVETYQELVSAVLYYVSEGESDGVIRFYNYSRDVESDLENACLEVVQEDPLGAYAVDYMKYDVKSIVAYDEATVHITYRRTREQIAGVVSVTGVSAIRSELSEAMEQFSPELVLRIGSFDESSVDIQQLAREAYYATPAAAFGMPKVTFAYYPEESAARQRVVEVLLTYSGDVQQLKEKQDELRRRLVTMDTMLQDLSGQEAARTAFAMVRTNATFQSDGVGTAYAALVKGSASSEGMALAFELLCNMCGVSCTVVEGTRRGSTHFWNTVDWGGGAVTVDVTASDGFGLTEEQLQQREYVPAAAS